jgi:Metallo-peptidase family M12/Domain of unknown function DUF11
MGSRGGTGAGPLTGWLLAVLTTVAPCANAVTDARILYFEPVRSFTPDRDAVLRKPGGGQLRELKFDAYGRRFDLSLDLNDALTPQSKAGASALQLYRGRINNVAGSWVRLAIRSGAVQGMLWDGIDLYVIEPAAQVRDALTPPPEAKTSGSVIFRLADVLIDANEASCAVDETHGSRKGSEQFDALLRELKSAPVVMQAASATVRLQISAMGDAQFLQRYGSEQEARDAILVRLNNVDGIFSSQLGVQLQVPTVLINGADSDQLSGATSANTLLLELGRLRKRSSELNSRGLTHLFTGRDLDGTTVGIAYLDELCHREYGAGLTEVRAYDAWRDSLIAAHEIGHNFGASHDGDSAGACAATPANAFLMSPSVSGSDQFSSCSLNVMRPNVQAASCITALPDADVAIAADLGTVRKPASRPFEWSLNIANVGGVAASRVRAEILVPPVVNIDDAYVIGGSCTSGAGMIFCELGDVPGGATRAVNLTLRSDVVGSNSISARVTSDADAGVANNRGDGALVIDREADFEIVLHGPTSTVVGAEFNVSFAVANHGASGVENLQIAVTLPAGVSTSRAELANGACTVAPAGVQCALPSLPAGGSATGVLALTATSAGSVTLRAGVSGSYIDPRPANDSAEHVLTVTPVSPMASQNAAPERVGRGGGGGASLAFLLGLAGLGQIRRRRRR